VGEGALRLHQEARLLRHRPQPVALVQAHMVGPDAGQRPALDVRPEQRFQRLVDRVPQERVIGIGHGDRHHPARLEDAVHLAQAGQVVGHMLQDFREDHRIERVVRERQVVDVALGEQDTVQMANIGLRLADDLPFQLQPDQRTPADVPVHVQIETAPARAVEDPRIVVWRNPLENRLHPLLEGHIRLIAGHVSNCFPVHHKRVFCAGGKGLPPGMA